MTEVEHLADVFEHSFSGDAWHGPSLMAILKDVDARKAAAHPIAAAHSIWELVLHIAGWEEAIRRRIEENNDKLMTEDFPAVTGASETAWKRALAELKSNHEALGTVIRQLPASRLDQKMTGRGQTVFISVYGVILHCAYHAGQIAVLKKDAAKDSRQ